VSLSAFCSVWMLWNASCTVCDYIGSSSRINSLGVLVTNSKLTVSKTQFALTNDLCKFL
jgi:hypothetical protein